MDVLSHMVHCGRRGSPELSLHEP